MDGLVVHQRIFKIFVFLLSVAILILANFVPTASAASVGGPRDCSENSVLRCGAHTTDELRRKYSSDREARVIFTHFGISSSDVRRLDTNGQPGHITRDGNVVVDGETVARGARTAGMHDMPGSRKVTRNGVTFYTRSTSTSFQQDRLPAFVMMRDGQFEYAVLASCGNPVTARPVKRPTPPPPPAPQPQEAPPQETPPPPPPVQQQVQVQEQQVVIVKEEQAPPPAPPPAPAPAPAAALPETGAGSAAGIGAGVTFIATAGHFLYGYIRRKYFFWI